jgi:hypothetical protein
MTESFQQKKNHFNFHKFFVKIHNLFVKFHKIFVKFHFTKRFVKISQKNSLSVAERFVYLNLRYLEAIFYRLDHPLRRRLETLRELNLGRCMFCH